MIEQSVNVDFQQAIRRLPKEVIKEFKADQKSTKPSSSKPKGGKSSSSDTGVGTGYSHGGQTGHQVESDINELKSGRFAGIFEGKVASMKKLKDLYKQSKKDDPKMNLPVDSGMGVGVGQGKPGMGVGQGIPGTGGTGKPTEIRELKVRDLKVDKFVQGGPSGPGGIIGGTQGGGRSGSLSGDAGGEISKFQIAGMSIGATMGLALKLGSSLAGMYQGVMQGQDRTLDATGGYMGGGGGLVNNAELAQISVSRAQLMGGSARGRFDSYNEWDRNSEGNYRATIRHRPTGIDSGIRFGQSMGIGAGQGSEFFTKLEKFGEFMGSRTEMRKIFADGVEAGFGGLKMQQFVREIVGVSENAYKSGLGIQSAADVANAFSSLSQMGIRDERVGSVYGNMNKNMTESGGFLNSLAMVGHIGSGKGVLESMMEAEKGLGSADNRGFAKQFMADVDPETQGLIMKNLGLMSATEAFSVSQSGKSALDLETPTDLRKGSDTLNRMDRVGQPFRAKGNEIDELIAFSDAAKGAYEIQLQITKELINTYKATEKLGKGIMDIVNKM